MDHGTTNQDLSNNFKNRVNMEEDIFDDSLLEFFENSDFNDTSQPKEKESGFGLNESLLNVSALCCDVELNGYDKLTGQTWIYPTNYPVRDYQFNIINSAMLENCLVSLPTGLGKTFIAAVVMYNFYRWYPLGKIIFTAPTRPLVAQQIEACYNIVAMPPKDTIEMTGQMQVNIRKTHWQTKRVFFATPQVIYNDIKSGMCPGDKIRCLVIDEAHKAKGNYAYGNIINTLTEMGHTMYRVLALSATPGNKVEDVIHIVKHLHISRLELRTENCLDVKAYSYARNINTVIVELGSELTRLRQQYVEILDGYTRKLKNYNIIQNLGNLSKGRIVMLYKEFQSRERGARHPQHNNIMRTFTLLITLYHGLELLVKHGSRVFLNFFEEHPEKTWVHFDNGLTNFFDKLRENLGVNPLNLDRSVLPDGTIPEMPSNLNFGHPKFDKLKEIMLKHFEAAKKQGQVTKAIVFCEYRESVNLVYCLLLQCRPIIVPEMFVGHGASGKDGKAVISQKQQLRVMRNFRSGLCNTLVCTCVAEEGLDVGSVDLILCFDVSTRSPIRLVQRCGRTGRERSGQVFILVTEGREHSTLLDCIRQNEGLNQRILNSEEVKKSLYKSNPRMIPKGFMPKCQKMFITVAKKESKEKPKETKEKGKEKLLKGQKDLRSMFLNKASSSKTTQREEKIETNNEWISKEEFDILFPEGYEESNFVFQTNDCWALKEFLTESNNKNKISRSLTKLEPQMKLQKTFIVGNSLATKLLTELSQQRDTKTKSPTKKDGDIRVLFSKSSKSIKDYTKSVKELGINNANMSNDILNILVDLSLENKSVVKQCYVCNIICKCSSFVKNIKKSNPSIQLGYEQPILPNIDLINDLSKESIRTLCEEISNNNNNMDSHKADSQTIFTNAVKTTDSNIKDIGSNELYSESKVINVCDEDMFEESDIFDEIDIPSEIPNKNSCIDKSELSLHDTVINDPKRDSNDLNNSNDLNDNISDDYNIFEDNIFNGTSDKFTPKISESLKIDVNANTDRDIGIDLSENGNNQSIGDNYNIDEVNDIFADNNALDDIPLTQLTPPSDDIALTQLTPPSDDIALTQLTPPSNSNTNEFDKSPIFNITKAKNAERNNTLEGNDTSEEHSPNFKILYESLTQNKKKDVIKMSPHTEDIPIFNDNDSIEHDRISEKSLSPLNSKVDTSDRLTTKDVNIEYNLRKILEYFQLNKISDLFQCPNNISFDEENAMIDVNINETLPSNETKCDEKDDSNEINTSMENPLSPSLLSGTSKSVTSPILFSQKQKTSLRLKKKTSPILNSQRPKNSLSISKSRKNLNSSMTMNTTPPTTEPDHRKMVKLEKTRLNDSEIIILDSDEDDFEDIPKELLDKHNSTKRKIDEIDCKSPYFKKKPKLHENITKSKTIKEKVMAALTSFHDNDASFPNDAQINYMQQSPSSQKENKDPFKSKIEMLKKFKYDTKNVSKVVLKENTVNISKVDLTSDDDFVSQVTYRKKKMTKLKKERIMNTKKNKKGSDFLDLEAELSEDASVSEDELSNDSTDSIRDFICDNETKHEDIQGIYLESVKSPVKGVFKLPQLPPLKKNEVLSQYVEEDTYEMDSFCVDSHVVFNETHEMSELELAEIILEERRRNRKYRNEAEDDEGSPAIKKNKKIVKRQINSDSDDSS